MNEDRKLTIHFNNGTKLEVSFPTQNKNSTAAVLEIHEEGDETDKLVIEAEGRLLVIPWASVKLLELTPAPPAIPFGAIKGARIVEAAANQP